MDHHSYAMPYSAVVRILTLLIKASITPQIELLLYIITILTIAYSYIFVSYFICTIDKLSLSLSGSSVLATVIA